MTEKNNLAEEVFCLQYELNTLANLLLRGESERWVPGFLREITEFSHSERYKLACKYIRGKKVLDVACGTGKGSNIMATVGAAMHVTGFDIQPEALRYANHRNGASNINFKVADVQTFELTNEFDVVVSFETIEHLTNYKAFLVNVSKCLKSDGLFIVSTPISSLPLNEYPDNPHHVQEWGFMEFQAILEDLFDIEKVYVQLYPKINTPSIQRKNDLSRRITNKIKRTFLGTEAPVLVPDSQATTIFSAIEEFTQQYAKEELGTLRYGYQIVIAKAK
ncbi:class I SAM-dependent methyltransferase [Mucilaginibacter psychrotolerans]|uniref:Class I SAM-dependent methyltransferase n=1 Tax=Mucilaginibacter psychrotolerans TaxID=1524096 RepID=A0A4Y8SQJ5_9SPHI|nr:class I SAM-dependent methyltransferase [Mucilaginibacter psychrotolerans]TFF40881.1 class I SAM-dependent methyltransferase [Mucilaginibacter psychrotolerans]